jgi:hypothetical protein
MEKMELLFLVILDSKIFLKGLKHEPRSHSSTSVSGSVTRKKKLVNANTAGG